MRRYEENVISLVGPPFIGLTPVPGVGLEVAGFTATVLTYPSLATATIYSDNAASPTVKTNPIVVGSDGRFFFYARNGRYQINLLKAGIFAKSLVDISLTDVAWLSVSTGAQASVAAATIVERTVALAGLVVGDWVGVSKPSHQAGLTIGSARVSAAGTLAWTYVNASAGAITPTNETLIVAHIPL